MFCCIQIRDHTCVIFLNEEKKTRFFWRSSRGEGEMPFWSSNPHLLPFHAPLLPISETEADSGGGPDGVCYTCFAAMRLLFIRRRGSSGGGPPPLDVSFCFRACTEARRWGASRRQKQMSLLDYHLSPCGRTLSSRFVCVGSAGMGVEPLLPGTENGGLISQYHWY